MVYTQHSELVELAAGRGFPSFNLVRFALKLQYIVRVRANPPCTFS